MGLLGLPPRQKKIALSMRKTWLLFSQTVTVLLAAYFVVASLKPEWLHRRPALGAVAVLEAPSGSSA